MQLPRANQANGPQQLVGNISEKEEQDKDTVSIECIYKVAFIWYQD